MRWMVALGLCASSAAAQPRVAPPPPAPNRKPALVTYTPAQLQAFAKAVHADKSGDLETAEDEYKNVLRGDEVANAYWNLADVDVRRERLRDAVESLEKYIQLAETPAEKAAGQKRIEMLKALPPRVSVSGMEPGGIVFVDGVRFTRPAPTTIELDPGRYVIDWISKDGYAHRSVRADAMDVEELRVDSTDVETPGGNVIIATSENFPSSGSWEHEGTTFHLNRRFKLPPGRYATPVYSPNRACSTLEFVVPRDGLVYVFVRSSERAERCYPITVTQTVVKR